MFRYKSIVPLIMFLFVLTACSEDSPNDTTSDSDCTSSIAVDTERGACTEVLSTASTFSQNITGGTRTINANNIPAHKVGLFGNVSGSLNPNAIRSQSSTYAITTTPSEAATLTSLLSSNGPTYSFGVLLNGVELDPVAAEPWPHEGFMAANVNWEWNLEATMVQIGLDCNNAHVQPSGKYHYHGSPSLYLQDLDVSSTEMTLIGYAADGFPVYYKYGYSSASDSSSGVKVLTSSYRLKSGTRPGDGVTAPCGEYTGVYSADFEFVEGLGDLDEANGRTGVTPEYPMGTYYYVVTDDFPNIPRYFRGTPSSDFRLGG
ncbi:MAG: YHYH protein [Melioribacteraceae bacterium]|nr:YHYH protein [Melioribacteraceae bacterium]MCF8263320.1 YHYH protein [Melioribacteraceae bacterium]MCF8413900.1 YHYH protein [Melioribacteraceae bacterium]MCF8431984.1 YHYH protein [Melioribacteraceae bacterium]